MLIEFLAILAYPYRRLRWRSSRLRPTPALLGVREGSGDGGQLPGQVFSRLRVRLLLLALLASLPALVLVAFFAEERRVEAAEDARQAALQVARDTAFHHRQLVEQTRRLLLSLAYAPALRGDDPDACSESLREAVKTTSTYVNLGLIRPDGALFCSALPFNGPLDLSDREYFQRALRTRSFVAGNYMVGRVSGEPSIVFALPILTQDPARTSVLYAAVSLRWIREHVDQRMLPAGSQVIVTDSAQRVLVYLPDGHGWTGRVVGDTEIGRAIASARGETTVEARGLDGERRLFGIVPFHESSSGDSLHLAVGIPLSVAYAEATAQLMTGIAAVGLAIGALVLFMGWGAKVFVLRQMDDLRHTAQRLQGGDLSARAQVSGGIAEIEELEGAFNTMAEALEKRVREIETLNRLYATLSAVNGTIVRVREREALLGEVCRITQAFGGFLLVAAVEYAEETGTARLVAHAGDPALSAALGAGLEADAAHPDAPTWDALRRGEDVICQATETLSAQGPFFQLARLRGCRSCAVLVLKGERIFGTLNLYATDPRLFAGESLRLLREIAGDAAFGLSVTEKEAQVQYLSFHDPLTGFANRTLFQDRVAQALGRARHARRALAVMAVSVERLVQINDIFGRGTGDAVLRAVAQALSAGLREGDTIARLSGHQFGLLLADLAHAEDAAAVARRLLDRCPAAVPGPHGEVTFGLAAGVAIFPQDGEDTEHLIRHAELAMHSAVPETGYTLAFFSHAMGERVKARQAIESGLANAWARGEMALHYQPIVDLWTGEVIGAEALIRWESPALGPVRTDQFIEIAESTGLIVPLGEWIFGAACRQAKQWAEALGRPFRLAVNISPRQLAQPDFAQRFARLLEEWGSGQRCIQMGLEITESALMRNLEQAAHTLQAVRDLGVFVAIDDFGTGYSSLAYLRKLPLDTLKIDRSFVRDVVTDAHAAAVVKSIIALGQSLDLRIVAEGVETEDQFRLLQELRCDAGQGYFFAPPLPTAEFEGRFLKPRRLDP